MRNYILFIVLTTLLVGSKAQAESSVPHLINMQSIVYDADGNLTKSDKVNLTVRILDEANNILYTESHAEVPVVEGAINIAIGDSGDTGGIPLEVLDPSKGTKLIDIEVDGQSAFELMPLSAVPYSMWSEKALTVAADSIGSEEIKDGSIKLVDLADEIKFSDIKGIADPNQLPASLATVDALNGHINSTTAHTASTIVVSGNFVTFVAANVQEALQKIDAKLADEVANRQGGQGDIGSALNTEIKNRIDADTVEAGIRSAADTVESQARQTGDATLQTNLDTHTLATTVHGSDGTVVGLNTLTIKIADHAALTQGVHGLSVLVGNTVVGTTETQTLENKTLTAPTINGGTIDGATITNSSFSGNGSNITNLNGSNIASGTIDDARLSANVTKLGSTIESGEIMNKTIVDEDISDSAAIATSKLSGAVTSIANHGLGDLAILGAVSGGAVGTITDGTITTLDIQDGTIALTDLGANGCANDQIMKSNGTSWACAIDVDTDTNSGGTVTSVGTGTGLTGGPIISSGTISLDYSAFLASSPNLAANQTVFGSTGLIFEGSIANAAEGLLTVQNPTFDRTWTLPDRNGTIITSGDSRTVTNPMIGDGAVGSSKIDRTSTSKAGLTPFAMGVLEPGALGCDVISLTSLNIKSPGTAVDPNKNNCCQYEFITASDNDTYIVVATPNQEVPDDTRDNRIVVYKKTFTNFQICLGYPDETANVIVFDNN